MKNHFSQKHFLLLVVMLGFLGGCAKTTPQVTPTSALQMISRPTPTPTKETVFTPTVTESNPVNPVEGVFTSLYMDELFNSVWSDEGTLHFQDWGVAIDIPPSEYNFLEFNYAEISDFEKFVFRRKDSFSNNDTCQTNIILSFYSIPEDAPLVNFSGELRLSEPTFPEIANMFGYEGSVLPLDIPAIGYISKVDQEYSCVDYIIHSTNNDVGIQLLIEFDSKSFDQAESELFDIMRSISYEEKSQPDVDDPVYAETYQSRMSANYISMALVEGAGLDLSAGIDGKGTGVDRLGRIENCADLGETLANLGIFSVTEINLPDEINPEEISKGDILIFSNSTIDGISDHATNVYSIDNGTIYTFGIYGPRPDTSYMIGYDNVPVTDFLNTIYSKMTIFHIP